MFLEELSGQDRQNVMYWLQGISECPSGDPRVIEAVRTCLDDRTVVKLWIPYSYGEVRWWAAHALAEELSAAGRPATVVLDDVTEPLNSSEVDALWDACGWAEVQGEDSLVQYELLHARGLLPARRLTVVGQHPPIDRTVPRAPRPTPLQDITGDDLDRRVNALLGIMEEPRPPADGLLSAVRDLLVDATPVLLPGFDVVVQMRVLAAHTLAALLRAGGSADPVVLDDVPEPVRADRLTESAGGPEPATPPALFARALAHGVLPRGPLRLPAPVEDRPVWTMTWQERGDVRAGVSALTDDAPGVRRDALLHLIRQPVVATPKVLAAVRALLEDRTPVTISWSGPVCAELRQVAAHALTAVLHAAGQEEPIVLTDVPQDLTAVEVKKAAERAGLLDPRAVLFDVVLLRLYTELRERGLVPRSTLALPAPAAERPKWARSRAESLAAAPAAAAANPPEPRLRRWAWARDGEAPTDEELVAALRRSEPEVRVQALQALSDAHLAGRRGGSKPVRAALRLLLTDDSVTSLGPGTLGEIRWAAAAVLAEEIGAGPDDAVHLHDVPRPLPVSRLFGPDVEYGPSPQDWPARYRELRDERPLPTGDFRIVATPQDRRWRLAARFGRPYPDPPTPQDRS
ncbi:hypothetical protein GCM10017581_099160 [Dactylosporangium matsuzakiense]|uniref:Uncharacterized protein n=1 Tax=Dactylosporangium matsuzakiense TaxID=53360 RepID=A0A9W6NT91_9ACTN|nr:hypothetical protein GCM10017581_099160 [Dactylosporangium matsuzakiense]